MLFTGSRDGENDDRKRYSEGNFEERSDRNVAGDVDGERSRDAEEDVAGERENGREFGGKSGERFVGREDVSLRQPGGTGLESDSKRRAASAFRAGKTNQERDTEKEFVFDFEEEARRGGG